MISLDCFACKSKITAPDEAAGRSGKCPKCGALILFPSPILNIRASPPAPAKPVVKVAKPKRKIFAKKENSRLPVYLACGTLGLVIILAAGAWSVVSVYLENRRSQQIQEQESAEWQRRREIEVKQNSFLEAQQQLDNANLTIRQEKMKKQQEAVEELDRQNRELKQKREQAAQEAEQKAQDLFDRQRKEDQEKAAKVEQEKRREAERKRQLEIIEQDHKTILAYKRIHIRGVGAIRDMLWSPPLRAHSLKGKGDDDDFKPKEGILYRLQGVVGENRTAVSYYFFMVNREVVAWQSAKSNKAVTMCKIMGELSSP